MNKNTILRDLYTSRGLLHPLPLSSSLSFSFCNAAKFREEGFSQEIHVGGFIQAFVIHSGGTEPASC